MIERNWYGCYSDSWKGEITDEAFAHPAKFARGLIRQIYQHALEQGYFKPGDLILDPFGGVALGARDAMQLGLDWLGIELEEKFVKLGNENLDLWRFRLRGQTGQNGLPELGQVVLLQGDSRYLVQVLAGGVVSSPPFSQPGEQPCASQFQAIKDYHAFTRGDGTKYDKQMTDPANLANLPEGNHAAVVVSSPPYTETELSGGKTKDGQEYTQGQRCLTEYGGTPGQLGAMRVVSSPPYAESLASDDPDKRGGLFKDPKRHDDKTLTAEYGESEGQLGAMKVVSSPPWEQTVEGMREMTYKGNPQTGHYKEGQKIRGGGEYGSSPGQLGQETGDDFWTAARQIMEQTYSVLQSGAITIWVLKAFVRNKEIVDFPTQWKQLGESCGFTTIEWIRAWLIEDRGKQYDLFGELHEKTVERKSFFRRLAENKGSPRIDFEVVLIQQK